jgi:hypothetical protein
MLKNTFKLPEEIGKGLNKDHTNKVLEERNKDKEIHFKIEGFKNERLEEICKESGVNKSVVLRYLVNEFINNNKK